MLDNPARKNSKSPFNGPMGSLTGNAAKSGINPKSILLYKRSKVSVTYIAAAVL